VSWDAAAAAPADASMRLLCDGRVVKEVPATSRLRYVQRPGEAGAASGALPAACRLEIGWDQSGKRVTWLATNPIYLRAADPTPVPVVVPPAQQTWRVGEAAEQWKLERDPETNATAGAAAPGDPAGPAEELRYTLRSGDRANQYAALVTEVGGLAQATRVSFTASSERPMRVSVQVRDTNGSGNRWLRSIYLDSQPRAFTIPFDDMTGATAEMPAHPQPASIRWLLFVIDTVNTLPGASGRVTIANVRFER
jgi:hypothetical protein